MINSRTTLRSMLATALGAFAALGAPLGVRFAAASLQAREARKSREAARCRTHVSTRPSGRRYPEQSDRQALRAYRRAQGGMGITEGYQPVPRGSDAHRQRLHFFATGQSILS